MVLLLNYCINNQMKFYKAKMRNIQQHQINTFEKFSCETTLEIDSHTGTHIDYPAHCVKEGKYGETYPAEYLCSLHVKVLYIDLVHELRPKVSIEDIKTNDIPEECEILIIKTYFSHLRNEDKYVWSSPIIDSEIPVYLKQKFPNIKAVGFDVISVTSQLDRDEGRKCHYNFLSTDQGREILIVEDMDLSYLKPESTIEKIIILPLFFQYMDGSPCSVIANIKEK